jgi:hypothetical protein
MRRLLCVLVFFVGISLGECWAGGKGGGSSGGSVAVKGYTTKNGTYVAPHTRAAPGAGVSANTTPRVSYPGMPATSPRTAARGQGDQSPEREDATAGSTPTEASKPKEDRVKAVTTASVGSLVLSIKAVNIRRVRFESVNGSQFSPSSLLVIDLYVAKSPSVPSVKYVSIANQRTKLTDEKGTSVPHIIKTPDGMVPTGRVTQAKEITIGKHNDVLVFELPESESDLFLELGIEGDKAESAKLVIPYEMISK